VNQTESRPVHNLDFCFFFYFFDELLECYVTDMDSLCIYSEEVNKVSDSLVREEDCIPDFTTDKVKLFVFVYVYEM